MQAISKVEGKLNCIPSNTEKYLVLSRTITIHQQCNSVQFLLPFLEKFVKGQDIEAMNITKQYELDDTNRKLLLCKGIYLYEYTDNWARFGKPTLPPKSAFHSTLNEENISDEDYDHANQNKTTTISIFEQKCCCWQTSFRTFEDVQEDLTTRSWTLNIPVLGSRGMHC